MKLKRNNEIIDVDSKIVDSKLIGQVNDNELSITILSSEENIVKILHNNEIKEAVYIEDRDKYYVQIDGKQYIFGKVEDEEDVIAGSGESEDIENIVPPMPGTIIKVNVAVGDKVKEGEAVIVVEAMKMETNLYTRITGKVTKVNAKEGDRVDSDTVLVVIEKDEVEEKD
ncbi:MAG: biotin/lipoyl-containing protein [Candidatus Kapaibacterium sp.]